MPSVKINGADYVLPDELSILQALHRFGIAVPTLCFDERLKPMGGCRLCVVNIAGHARPVPACTTQLAEGMHITTHDDDLESYRRTLLRLLARDYPMASFAASPDKEFHAWLRHYGVIPQTPAESLPLNSPRGSTIELPLMDDSHPFIHVDMRNCITCLRCVRVCDEVQGQFVWQVWNRGDRTAIRPNSGTTLLESSCVSCGACVDTCPTGALEDKSVLAYGAPTRWTKTICAYCGTGCEMHVGVAHERIVAVRPDLTAPVNQGHLCVKGRYAFDFVHAADRVTQPMLREQGGQWQRVSWETAIGHVAQTFHRILTEYGARAIGVLGSARATNEENYLAQKFARVVLGTNNVDCCARVCHAPTAAAMKAMLGTGAATNSFADIELAQTILVAGCNPTENHPIVGARIKQAKLRGAKLIVIDPRGIELTQYADVHLQLRPGTNVLLFNSLAATIVEEGLCDAAFARERVDSVDTFSNFIGAFAPEAVTQRCGVEAEAIRRAARLYATAKPALAVHGLGMTEHVQGTEGVMCLVNLALLTGNLGRPGSGINPLRGQNNVQGSAQMGCEPSSLTGAQSLAENRERFEGLWQANLPTSRGLNLLQMMDAAEKGEFKALWAIGYDVLLTNANAHATRRAMRQMECVVVQDLFLNETAKEFGTVFLPAASPYEKDGTYMNAERRIQRVREVIAPLGDSRPDWRIVCDVARAMGCPEGFTFSSPEAIWNEVRSVWPAATGISYARIEEHGLQWPCPAEDHPGTQILHVDKFPLGQRAQLRTIEYRPTQETVSDDYPFLLTTGRTLYHFNAGTMTQRSKTTILHPHDYLDISPADAAALNLVDGESVIVFSRYGETELVVRLNSAIHLGQLFCTFHDSRTFVNHVTSPNRDSVVHAPEYKVTAVGLRKKNGSCPKNGSLN